MLHLKNVGWTWNKVYNLKGKSYIMKARKYLHTITNNMSILIWFKLGLAYKWSRKFEQKSQFRGCASILKTNENKIKLESSYKSSPVHKKHSRKLLSWEELYLVRILVLCGQLPQHLQTDVIFLQLWFLMER